MKIKIILIAILNFSLFTLNAQLVNVNSSSYSPTSPLECQDFFVTVDGVVNCNNYQYDSTSSTITGNTIEVGVYYTGGPICTGALSYFSYQENVGNIPQGTYNVVITGYLNMTQDDQLIAPNVTIGSCCGTDASFTSNQSFSCTDLATDFTLTNTSTGATTNTWYINDVFAGNSTNFTVPGNIVGTYEIKLVTSNGTCSDSVIQTFNVFESPELNLGNDTGSCVGLTYNITAPMGFSSYTWTNNNSSNHIASVTATNKYHLSVVDANGCPAEDSVLITFHDLPVFSLGPDTNICENQTYILDPGAYEAYNWNTSDTTQTITATSSFNYSVEVTDQNGCKNTDNVSIFVNSAPVVNLQDTFETCEGTSVTLDAGMFNSYIWSTGEATQTIDVQVEGEFNVMVSNAAGCETLASTYVKVNDLPMVSFNSDTTGFCEGNSVTLDAGVYNSYSWSTNATSQTIDVSTEGTYSLTVENEDNCSNSASIYVVENNNPVVNLGEDRDLCKSDKITLDAGDYTSYLWNDGSTMQTFEVIGANISLGNNTFSVEVEDANGCNGTDDIIINVKECNVSVSSEIEKLDFNLYPNPVKDILNLHLKADKEITLKIYNVLGKEMYSFNGTINNYNKSIDLSKLSNGLYILNIEINNESFAKSFTIAK